MLAKVYPVHLPLVKLPEKFPGHCMGRTEIPAPAFPTLTSPGNSEEVPFPPFQGISREIPDTWI
jgi:hypothetical protein